MKSPHKEREEKKHPKWHLILGTNHIAIPSKYVSTRYRQGIVGEQTIWLETCRVCGELLDETATSTFPL